MTPPPDDSLRDRPCATDPAELGPMAKKRIQKIGSLVNQLMARHGYAQVTATEQLQSVIAATLAPPIAADVQVGNLKRGVLHVFASNSVTLQELNFQKRLILRRIQKEMPDAGVTDLRFRIQV